MTHFFEVDGGDWLDEHRTCDRKATRVFKVKEEPSGDLSADLTERSEVIGAMMDQLAAQDSPIAITGSAWSQSDVFPSPAVKIDTALDRAVWSVPGEAFAHGVGGDTARFVMATGGAKLFEIMEFLDERGYSFRTAGSHKGQSIGGAIATGTHGSLLGEMGLETHVRGLLFVNGTGMAHWIADPKHPVLRPEFVQSFASIADSSHFADALIHLGGLGYCAAVLLEAIPRFGLSWSKRIEPLPDGWWDAVSKADFKAATAGIIGDKEPAFYELTFDPNASLDAEVMQTVYWRDALQETGPQAPTDDDKEDTRDALDVLVDQLNAFSESMVASRKAPREIEDTESESSSGGLGFLDLGFFTGGGPIRLLDIPEMIFDDFRESAQKLPDSNKPSSLLALTGDWEPRSVFGIRIDTFNAAICVPVEQLKAALEIGTANASKFRKHYVFTVRFAAKSRASMSFLRFEQNAIINIDGLTRAGIAGWISHSDEASRAFTDALEEAGIPFSMHWGKDIPSDAAKIKDDFGEAVSRFKALREALVPAALRARLHSPMLEHWGLT